jgi:hypothetical protein
MNRFLLVLLSAALAAPLAAQAPPKPAAKKKPGASAPKPLPAADPELKAIEQTVRDYVRDQAEEEGSFTVEDDVLARSWDAKLLMVRGDTVRRPAPNRAIVCVEFKGEDEKNAQALDLDFTMSNDGESWTVDEIVIHSVAGKERFAYNKKHGRVPVKEPKGPKKPKAAQALPAGDAPDE